MAPVEKEKPSKAKSFSELMTDHLESSSAPGLPKIQRSETLLGKAFWGVLVLCGVIMVCWQIDRLYVEYKSYPIRVTMTYEYNRSLRFPAVTICNMNPLRSSMLDPDLMDITLMGYSGRVNPPSTNNHGSDDGQPKPPKPPPPHPSSETTKQITSTESSSVFESTISGPTTSVLQVKLQIEVYVNTYNSSCKICFVFTKSTNSKAYS